MNVQVQRDLNLKDDGNEYIHRIQVQELKSELMAADEIVQVSTEANHTIKSFEEVVWLILQRPVKELKQSVISSIQK